MELDIKTLVALKEAKQLDSVPETIESLEHITKGFTELIQSIYDSKPDLGEGEVFIETLSIKILLASKSIIELGKGTDVSTLTKIRDIKLLDFPTINIITRSIIEAFLTLEYLFFNDLEKEERIFRFHIWQISGYKSRQNFIHTKGETKNEINKKLQSEILEINRLKLLIEKSPFYKDLNKQNLWKLDTYGLPRLVSWSSLIKESRLKSRIFETTYKLYSNYAHSEFISLIQMRVSNSLNQGSKQNNDSLLNSLRIIKMLNCITMIELINKFEPVSKVFDKYDDEFKTTVLFWNEFGRE